jgi:hypothetical protein
LRLSTLSVEGDTALNLVAMRELRATIPIEALNDLGQAIQHPSDALCRLSASEDIERRGELRHGDGRRSLATALGVPLQRRRPTHGKLRVRMTAPVEQTGNYAA